MNNTYDYILVGGGPTSLTIATFLSLYKKKTLILEKENEIGGCHRVIRDQGYLTEHGPRVYSSSFINFINILKLVDIKFDDLFIKYNYSVSDINMIIMKIISIKELLILTISFIIFIICPFYWKKISIKDYLDYYNFSDNIKDFFNRLCIFTEGGDITKYTVFKLFQLLNQQIFYDIYQPKIANDLGLFKLWNDKLNKKYITILTNHKVNKLNKNNNIIISIEANNNIYYANKYILGIPPKNILSLLKNSNITDAYYNNLDKLQLWVDKNSYIDYISITFHWKEKIKLPHLWGFPSSKWGLGFIVLSDYIDTLNEPSQTIITCALCILDKKSISGKTVNESTKEELLKESYNQLLEYFPELKNYKVDRIILSPKVYKEDNKWKCYDTAFINSNDNKFLNSISNNYKNLINVGTHNGLSNYHFTTIESSVINAIEFINNEIPESKKIYRVKKTYELTTLIYFILIIVMLFLIKNKK